MAKRIPTFFLACFLVYSRSVPSWADSDVSKICGPAYQKLAETSKEPRNFRQIRVDTTQKTGEKAKDFVRRLGHWWKNPRGFYPKGNDRYGAFKDWLARGRRLVLKPVRKNGDEPLRRFGGLLTEWKTPRYERPSGDPLARPEKLIQFIDPFDDMGAFLNPRAFGRYWFQPPEWKYGLLNPVDHFRSWLYQPFFSYVNPRHNLRKLISDEPYVLDSPQNYLKEALRVYLYERGPLHYVNPLTYVQAPVRHLSKKVLSSPKTESPEKYRFHENVPHETAYSLTPLRAVGHQWSRLRNATTRSLFGRAESLSFMVAFPLTWIYWNEIFEGMETANEKITEWKERAEVEANKEHYNHLLRFDIRFEPIKVALVTGTLPPPDGKVSNWLVNQFEADPLLHQARWQVFQMKKAIEDFQAVMEATSWVPPKAFHEDLIEDPAIGPMVFSDLNYWREYGLSEEVEGFEIPEGLKDNPEEIKAHQASLLKEALIRERKYMLTNQWLSDPEGFEQLLAVNDPIATELESDPQFMGLKRWLEKESDRSQLDPGHIRLGLHSLILHQYELRTHRILGLKRPQNVYVDIEGHLQGDPAEEADEAYFIKGLQNDLMAQRRAE